MELIEAEEDSKSSTGRNIWKYGNNACCLGSLFLGICQLLFSEYEAAW